MIFSIVISSGCAQKFPYTGTFSNLRCIKSNGDILGMELNFISGFNDPKYDYYVILQLAEGVIEKPQIIPVTIEDGNFSFNAKYLGGFNFNIQGKISNNSVSGTLGKPLNQKFFLKKGSSFWQKTGDLCFR